MRLLKNRFFGFYLGFVLILAMTIGGSAIAAFADCTPGTDCGQTAAILSGGDLTEAGTFGESNTFALTGSDQKVNYTLPITVTDARGSGLGWNLTISGTPLSDPNGDTLTQQVHAAAAVCATGSTCTLPTNNTHPISYPVVIGSGTLKFFSADANTGMGVINITTTVQIVVPGNAIAATYTTDLTLASVSGP